MKIKSLPLKVTLLYMLIGSIWVLFADVVFQSVGTDLATRDTIKTAAGCVYLLTTGVLFFMLLSSYAEHLVSATSQLQENESRLQAIFDGAVHGIVTISEKGIVESMNSTAESLFGYAKSEVIGQNVKMLMPEPDHARHDGYISRYLQTGENRIIGVGREVIGLRKDGSQIPLHLSVTEVYSAGKRIFTGIMHDISQKILAERALAEEKERLSVTLRSIGDGVITTDLQGCVTMVNKSAELMTGWAQAEARGKPLKCVLKLLTAQTRKAYSIPLESVLLLNEPIELQSDVLLIAKDGSERLIADSIAPIHDHESALVGAVCVFRDITEKRKIAQQHRRAEKAEAISILAAGIAHDFNNYLNIVSANVAFAKMSASSNTDIKDSLSEAEKACGWAKEVVQQLITFARGAEPTKKVVAIGEIVRDAASFALSGSSVACEFAIPDDLASVEIDKGQVTQVINNLIINADQAMPDGGIVRVHAKNVHVATGEISDLPSQNYVKISIVDQGTGVSSEHIEKVFTPYFTTKEHGSGLGLATSYAIMKKHGGTITVESIVDKGTIFSMFLPATADAPPGPISEDKEIVVGRGRILLMDDNESLRKVTVKILRKLGYEAEPAADGAEAVQKYKAAMQGDQPFDVAILDLTIIGGIGGLDTLGELLKLDASAKAIASSGYSMHPAMVNFREYGFSGVVIKPYKLDELSVLLNGLVSAHCGE